MALYGALVDELGVAPNVVAILHCMYSDIQTQFLHGLELSGSFLIHLGVLQGCSSSPAIFSLFINRLKSFLDGVAADSTTSEVEVVQCASLLLSLLLFVDDIAIPSGSFAVLHCLVHALGVFCSGNQLMVNLSKTAWLVGGCVPHNGTKGFWLMY